MAFVLTLASTANSTATGYKPVLRCATVQHKVYYERNLPHWHPPNTPLFITWRLFGSLPKSVLVELDKKNLTGGKRFAVADKELDRAATGPLWLKDARLAKVVVDALRRGGRELAAFALHAFVVMANHVHVLITPKLPVIRILRGIKRRTANDANTILHRPGQRFWAEESFDHWCRTAAESERIKSYIEWNPVKAGLVKRPEDWSWSSATRNTGL